MWGEKHTKTAVIGCPFSKKFSSPEGPGRGLTSLDSIKTRGYTGKKLTLFL